ncbi:MAG TPA: PDZ domain-containing protein [Actinomycetota bacterium]|nr:PDZ domain-containing protein [Actinomycetota bacterium]
MGTTGAARTRGDFDVVRYRVRLLPARHEIEVSMEVPFAAATEGTIALETPTWVPGDYEFVPYGRDVFGVRAADAATGAPLRVRRSGWQGYAISGVTGDVTVTYTGYCSSWDFSEACGIVGESTAVLTGARYLRVPSHPGPCAVAYELPAGWAVHHPSGAEELGEHEWLYPSYEILLDTPVSFGDFRMIVRDVRGTPFHFVFLDSTIGSDGEVEEFTERVDAAAATFHDVFGSFPFEDYTFVCSVNPNAQWGLEHLTSTMVGLGPDVFTNPDQNATGVRVCAHELFHAWNVRRLRPAPLGDLDLAGGSFTEGLWLAEGFTRYYEFLSCTRANVYTPAQFFSAVVNYYRHLEALPAYERVSPVDASLASFLNHSDKYPGRVNDAIDYYDAGMLIAFATDVLLRTETPLESLDTAFAAFYEEFAGRGTGYTPETVRDFFEQLHPGSGKLAYVAATTPGALPVVDALVRLGFEVHHAPVPALGVVFLNDGAPTIYGVLDDSPAAAEGLASEDVIAAVDGRPFELPALEWAVAHSPTVEIEVWRGNERLHRAVAPEARERIARLVWKGDGAQAALVSRWLGRPFDLPPGSDVPLDFYENFHGVETVV